MHFKSNQLDAFLDFQYHFLKNYLFFWNRLELCSRICEHACSHICEHVPKLVNMHRHITPPTPAHTHLLGVLEEGFSQTTLRGWGGGLEKVAGLHMPLLIILFFTGIICALPLHCAFKSKTPWIWILLVYFQRPSEQLRQAPRASGTHSLRETLTYKINVFLRFSFSFAHMRKLFGWCQTKRLQKDTACLNLVCLVVNLSGESR